MSIHIEIPADDITLMPVTNVSAIPKQVGGLYKFYGEDYTLLYVGKSKMLRDRITHHVAGKSSSIDIYHNFRYVSCIFIEDPLHREIYETYMINTLQPLLNGDKVITYTSQKYEPKYNPNAQHRDEQRQIRIDKAMENFGL